MAEDNNPSPISQSGTAQPVPVKIAKETEPDMDVLEWAKKHIEIPEMRARLSGLPVQEIEPKRRIRNRTSQKMMPKADHVRPDKPEVQNTSRNTSGRTTPPQAEQNWWNGRPRLSARASHRKGYRTVCHRTWQTVPFSNDSTGRW